MITLRLVGLSEAVSVLQRLPAKLERQTILRMSQVAYDEAQRGALRHSKTGALVQSLYNRAIPTGRAVGHDTQRAPYAGYVNLGTRPHVIRPKAGGQSSNSGEFGPVRVGKRKALRWVVGNGYAFAKKVNHPGYRGDAYLISAATMAVREFAAAVNAAFKEST